MTLRPSLMLLIAAGLTGCGNPNAVPVRGQIASIDRKCSFTTVFGEEGRRERGRPGRGEMMACDTTGEFEALRNTKGTRTKNIVGKAVVTVSFDSPVDQSGQTAELTLDGSDDAFYSLHYGDAVDLIVDKTDLTKVRLADS